MFQLKLLSSDGDLRLVQNGISNSSYTRGRLEVYYSGLWGTVCDNSWSSANTRVACRQLGFPTHNTSWTTSSAGGWGVCTLQLWAMLWTAWCSLSQSRATVYIYIYLVKIAVRYIDFFLCSYGSATGTIWLDNVRCSGSESRLISCQRNNFGSNDCSHSQDVAINCNGTTTILSHSR